MEKYSYIIIGIIALIFNMYRKMQKKKKEAEMAMQMQQQQNQRQEPKQTKPKENIITDLLQDFEKQFKDIEDDYIPKSEPSQKTYNIPDIENVTEEKEELEEIIEDYEVENKTIVKPKTITKNNVKINLKQAIIYNTILEKKY